MPCIDYREEDNHLNETLGLKHRLDTATRLLCGVMHGLAAYEDATEYVIRHVDGLKEWWDEHQRLDALREAKERVETQRKQAELRSQQRKAQLAKAALAKLSYEERKALGI